MLLTIFGLSWRVRHMLTVFSKLEIIASAAQPDSRTKARPRTMNLASTTTTSVDSILQSCCRCNRRREAQYWPPKARPRPRAVGHPAAESSTPASAASPSSAASVRGCSAEMQIRAAPNLQGYAWVISMSSSPAVANERHYSAKVRSLNFRKESTDFL